MRVASNVMASIQQAQNRDARSELNRSIQDKNNQDRYIAERGDNSIQDRASQIESAQKAREDRISRIKEEIKNGSYKLDLAATSERMAQSLLNA